METIKEENEDLINQLQQNKQEDDSNQYNTEQIKTIESNYQQLNDTYQNLLAEYYEFKSKHSDEIKQVHLSYIDQLKEYETNIEIIKNEKQNLENELNKSIDNRKQINSTGNF